MKQHKTIRIGRRWFFFKAASKGEPFWWHSDGEGRRVRSRLALTTHSRETGHCVELIVRRFLFATIKERSAEPAPEGEEAGL